MEYEYDRALLVGKSGWVARDEGNEPDCLECCSGFRHKTVATLLAISKSWKVLIRITGNGCSELFSNPFVRNGWKKEKKYVLLAMA